MHVISEIRILSTNWCVSFKAIVRMLNKLKFKMYYHISYLNDNDYDIIPDAHYNVTKLTTVIRTFIA